MTAPTPAPVADPVAGTDRPIIFFDGVCGLCNRLVNFLLPRDTQGIFRFATLQGETARKYLPESDRINPSSSILLDRGKRYSRSTGAVRILMKLGGGWAVLGAIAWLVPWPLRDLAYKGLAAVRYRLFGKSDTCRLPRPEERGRFLD